MKKQRKAKIGDVFECKRTVMLAYRAPFERKPREVRFVGGKIYHCVDDGSLYHPKAKVNFVVSPSVLGAYFSRVTGLKSIPIVPPEGADLLPDEGYLYECVSDFRLAYRDLRTRAKQKAAFKKGRRYASVNQGTLSHPAQQNVPMPLDTFRTHFKRVTYDDLARREEQEPKKCEACGRPYVASEHQRRPLCGRSKCKQEYTKREAASRINNGGGAV